MTGSIRIMLAAALCGVFLQGVPQNGWATSWEPCPVCHCCDECICVPNAKNFGYFETQWRRWPAEQRPNVDFPESVGDEMIPTPYGQPQPLPTSMEPLPGISPGYDTSPSVDTGLPSLDFPIPEPTVEVPERTPPSNGPPIPVVPGTPQSSPPTESPIDTTPEFPIDTTPETPLDVPLETPTETPTETPAETRMDLPVGPSQDNFMIGSFLQSGRSALAEEPRQSSSLLGASGLGVATYATPESQQTADAAVHIEDIPPEATATVTTSQDVTRQAAFQSNTLQANWTAALDSAHQSDVGRSFVVYPSAERLQPAVHYTEANPQPKNEPPAAQHEQDAPVALDGYCPVELSENERWLSGDPQWSVVYQGYKYLFHGLPQKQRFLANPNRYAPACSAQDPVLAVDENRFVEGVTDHCVIYDGQLYMFSSTATLARFKQAPQRYTARIVQ